MATAVIILFLILLIVRIEWLYAIDKINNLRRRLRNRFRKKVSKEKTLAGEEGNRK